MNHIVLRPKPVPGSADNEVEVCVNASGFRASLGTLHCDAAQWRLLIEVLNTGCLLHREYPVAFVVEAAGPADAGRFAA